MLDHTSDSVLCSLVTCDCGHDVGKHEARGCTAYGCRCGDNRQNLIENALESARVEQRESLLAFATFR